MVEEADIVSFPQVVHVVPGMVGRQRLVVTKSGIREVQGILIENIKRAHGTHLYIPS